MLELFGIAMVMGEKIEKTIRDKIKGFISLEGILTRRNTIAYSFEYEKKRRRRIYPDMPTSFDIRNARDTKRKRKIKRAKVQPDTPRNLDITITSCIEDKIQDKLS